MSIVAVCLGLFPGFFFCGLPKANSGATAVLVDELHAGCPLYALLSCSRGDPIRPHKEIDRDLPTCRDLFEGGLLGHLRDGPGLIRPGSKFVCKRSACEPRRPVVYTPYLPIGEAP
jgi:hypothetical protein